MSIQLEISDKDEESFNIDGMEIVFEAEGCYIITEEAFFIVDDISDFYKDGDNFCLTYEDNVLTLSQDQYEIISKLFLERN